MGILGCTVGNGAGANEEILEVHQMLGISLHELQSGRESFKSSC